jgi:hypothetical protein
VPPHPCATVTVRLRRFSDAPVHVSIQSPYAPNADTSQFTGVDPVQMRVSVVSGQKSGVSHDTSQVTFRGRVCVPSPQVAEQAPQSPQLPYLQSFGTHCVCDVSVHGPLSGQKALHETVRSLVWKPLHDELSVPHEP